MPSYLTPKTRLKWLLAHFTQLALETDGAQPEIGSDDEDEPSAATPATPPLTVRISEHSQLSSDSADCRLMAPKPERSRPKAVSTRRRSRRMAGPVRPQAARPSRRLRTACTVTPSATRRTRRSCLRSPSP